MLQVQNQGAAQHWLAHKRCSHFLAACHLASDGQAFAIFSLQETKLEWWLLARKDITKSAQDMDACT